MHGLYSGPVRDLSAALRRLYYNSPHMKFINELCLCEKLKRSPVQIFVSFSKPISICNHGFSLVFSVCRKFWI